MTGPDSSRAARLLIDGRLQRRSGRDTVPGMPVITAWKAVEAERVPAHRLWVTLAIGPDPMPPGAGGSLWSRLMFIPAVLDTMRETVGDAGPPDSRKPRTSFAELVLRTFDDELVNLELVCLHITGGEPCGDEQLGLGYPGLSVRVDAAMQRLSSLEEALSAGR